MLVFLSLPWAGILMAAALLALVLFRHEGPAFVEVFGIPSIPVVPDASDSILLQPSTLPRPPTPVFAR